MSPEYRTYTVLGALPATLAPSPLGPATGETIRSRQPLLDGAGCWMRTSADHAATIITAWWSGNGEWVLHATVGHAAKLTVRDNCRGTPTFEGPNLRPHGSLNRVARE